MLIFTSYWRKQDKKDFYVPRDPMNSFLLALRVRKTLMLPRLSLEIFYLHPLGFITWRIIITIPNSFFSSSSSSVANESCSLDFFSSRDANCAPNAQQHPCCVIAQKYSWGQQRFATNCWYSCWTVKLHFPPCQAQLLMRVWPFIFFIHKDANFASNAQ